MSHHFFFNQVTWFFFFFTLFTYLKHQLYNLSALFLHILHFSVNEFGTYITVAIVQR